MNVLSIIAVNNYPKAVRLFIEALAGRTARGSVVALLALQL